MTSPTTLTPADTDEHIVATLAAFPENGALPPLARVRTIDGEQRRDHEWRSAVDEQDRARDQRVREWKRLSVKVATDMDRWNLVYQLVLAERNEARSLEARQIADAMCFAWGRVEQAQRTRGVKS